MESLEDTNCYSLSDNFSLYERYMRSFNVVDHLVDGANNREACEPSSSDSQQSSVSRGNIDLTVAPVDVINKHCETAETECNLIHLATYDNTVEKNFNLDTDLVAKTDSPCNLSSHENSSTTIDRSLLQDKSNHTDVHVSSEESKAETCTQPVFITSTMENSNNAVDSVPLFRDVRPSESVFKLPTSELSFNGTIKHVKKLKPIVDPITALSCSNRLVALEDKSAETSASSSESEEIKCDQKTIDISNDTNTYSRTEQTSESTGDSQYDEFSSKKNFAAANDEGSSKWNFDHSYSSLEGSFDSGVRSPDMFSDEEDDEEVQAPESEPFWSFLKDYEAYDKRKVKKMEEILQGVLPPPSVTILRTDIVEMLKKYYCYLPLFNDSEKVNTPEVNSTTPKKMVSFVEIPEQLALPKMLSDIEASKGSSSEIMVKHEENLTLNTSSDLNVSDKSVEIKLGTEMEAAETAWPEVLKCRYYDVYYNVTKYSERFELLALRYGERYVGAETDTSVNIHSGGLQSPSSASKRKALRLKMAQAKSPGRRLSHLARRRQAFCSAATINEKAQTSAPKMVLIDKNFFPHRKLINSAERKSPRYKRTPGKKTPRRTPGKKTPAKTPTTRSGGSSKKKAMRRLLLDSETLSRTQPTRETLKRALFISPENKKIPQSSCSSVPVQAMKSRRALFGSPIRTEETKSLDGTQSDHFLKRKLDALDEQPESSRSKIAKSLSFGGDTISNAHSIGFSRRSSEVFTARNTTELNETHKKKLLWAVSEALRVHGWRMSSAGFREKASALARLTRRLLALPPHAARLAAPSLSTSDTMLKLARQYVFAIIQGRSVEDCFQEEQMKLANEANGKVTGYISATAYQQRARQVSSTFTSQIKENYDLSIKQDPPKSASKNVLQDKLVNIDTNSNSSSGLSLFDKSGVGLFKSNSMPSFEEAAKMRARRQISFDNIDLPKR
ncbi:uncharacterized protein LOC115447560 isoform X1 [Manduca sexta]|uniref:uncharacterized protein LOC115447560 isoform X1 n=2 Tax=Manduca sexta TaxID=7130 RepID=UPI0018902D60|nr:uncharacterized protein LOC115447560 isoform X1 [Manduca sexta]